MTTWTLTFIFSSPLRFLSPSLIPGRILLKAAIDRPAIEALQGKPGLQLLDHVDAIFEGRHIPRFCGFSDVFD